MLHGERTRSEGLVGIVLFALVGAIAAALVLAGNPGNMGLCGACFLRDLGGALSARSGPAIVRPALPRFALGFGPARTVGTLALVLLYAFSMRGKQTASNT